MRILVDPRFDPTRQSSIESSTKLAEGITCAKFLGARGSQTNFERLYNESFNGPADRFQIASYLYIQAQLLKMAVDNDSFSKHRIIVSDGIYEPTPYFVNGNYVGEIPTRGFVDNPINQNRRTGKTIGYQIINKAGKSDPSATFDLAVFWKDYGYYDKLDLDYDTYNLDGSITGTVFITLPDIESLNDNLKFKRQISTYYNGELQSKSNFQEILE